MGRKPIVTVEIIQTINKLYNEGYTMQEIGKELNLSHGTIGNYVWEPRRTGNKEVI